METRIAQCSCGAVQFEARGAPILGAVCYCDDCQAGGRQIEALPNATPIRDEWGGSPYLTYRDDRFGCIGGKELLRGLKLGDSAPTTRFVASCCNSGMYLKYAPGWWVSVYRTRFSGDVPPLEMRSQTKNVPGVALPTDLPIYHGFAPMLLAKLMAARVAMLFAPRTKTS